MNSSNISKDQVYWTQSRKLLYEDILRDVLFPVEVREQGLVVDDDSNVPPQAAQRPNVTKVRKEVSQDQDLYSYSVFRQGRHVGISRHSLIVERQLLTNINQSYVFELRILKFQFVRCQEFTILVLTL